METKHYILKLVASCICLASTYTTASPVPSKINEGQIANITALTPGTILSLQVQTPDLFSNAAERYIISYRSRGVHSEPIVASGYVLLPKGKAPKGGWPVLAWAHGTTGVADTCAPSGDYADGPVHIYQQIAAKALNAWLARGYAVVAPDYQGLGTPGGYQYEGIAEYVANQSNIDPSVAAFLPIVLLGAEAAEPTLSAKDFVSPEMQKILNQARNRCLSELQTELKISPKTVFKPNVDLTPLTRYLKKQSIELMTPQVPLLLVQGDQDQLVDYRGVHAYYQKVCKENKPIAFHPIKNGDHRDSLKQSEYLIDNFIHSIENKTYLNTCPTNSYSK